MRVLVACEESQTVCKSFRSLGHEAYSCDIQPCSGGHPEWHLQVDALEMLKMRWDMIIAFPPCTDLAALTDSIVALQRQDKKAQLWDAIFPAILQCASGDSGLHINQLYEVYMRGTKYTDDLVCSMSKLLIRAAESNVYSHDTALVRELIKILVAEVFENRENREEEE